MALKFSVQADGMDAVKEAISKGCDRAEHVLAVQVAKDTAPFVPMLTGSLRTRTRVTGNTVVYPGPYARYLYYGKLYVDPLTGSSYRAYYTSASHDIEKVENGINYWGEIEIHFIPIAPQITR